MTKITLKPKPFLCLLLALLLLSLPGIAVGLEVQTSSAIHGEGTIDKEVSANTEAGLSGIKYIEYFHTQSLGRYGPSDVNYTSDFCMIADTKENSTITIDSTFTASNIYQIVSVMDYRLRSKQSFWARGDVEAVAMFSVDNHSSSLDFAQAILGAGGYRLLVRNSTDWHTKEYLETAEYNGTYDIVLGSFFGTPYYPKSELCGWLDCPGGQDWGTREFGNP